MHYVAMFFAGAFLCNSLPHLAAGLRGEPFPSPFASPPGKGDSSPLVNFLWGLFNLLAGGTIVVTHPLVFGSNPDFLTVLAGVVFLGVYISIHFGRVRSNKQ
ncbi:MAG: hypothetical protein JOY51_05625 [Nevskia sp.]|nr:hypothetical protein [Nevskia sp.]